MAFADLSARLHLNISDFSANLNRASRQMNRFANDMYSSYGLAARELNKHNLGLKDTVRIVHGIVVAQTFYNAARAITSATSALWNFNVALDYMHVTYSALFGDAKLASDFMGVLQEHSIETIFDYQNLADASKKLLAYGIEYKNLMFIMEGLTNLGAMSGDSAALDRIALALGQIYTKGKLSAEEMRQLANAYIPITEILQDKFGLTGDDLKRVGDLGLPAADVINAIVDYANENFGSVGDAAMYTITGLQNKIVDTLKVLGAEMLKPVTTAYKSFLAYVSGGLETLREAYGTGGFGGVFEALVPDPAAQQTIRQFIANVRNLLMSLASAGTVVGAIFANFGHVFVTAFNIITPVVVTAVNAISALLNAFLQTSFGATALRVALVAAAGAFVVLKVHALAALVITSVTKAIMGLSKALVLLSTLITKHPILALLAGIAVALVGVSAASSNANASISGLFDTLSGATGGSSASDVLQDANQELQDGSEAADQFNNRLEQSKENAEDLEDALGGAGKEAKKTAGLLSFDEVFKLNDNKSSGSGSGAGSTVLDDISDVIDGLGGLGDALIPEIPDFTDYISDFTDGLFGGLGDAIVDKFASTSIGALIGGGIGAIIGGLLGGPAGALLGAKIGAFAGGLAGLFWDSIVAYFDPANNPLTAFFANTALQLADWASTTLAGLGSWWAGTVSGFSTWWNDTVTGFESWNKATGEGIAQWYKDTFTGISTWWEDTTSGFSSWWEDTTSGFSSWWENTDSGFATWVKDTVSGLSSWWEDTVATFSDWDSLNSETLSNWWSNTTAGFTSWVEDTTSGLSTWWSDTTSGFSTWWSDTLAGFIAWNTATGESIAQWYADTFAGISTWWADTLAGFGAWWGDVISGFATWITNSVSAFEQFKTDAGELFTSILTTIGEAFDTGFTNIGKALSDFFSIDNLWELIKEGINALTSTLADWWEGLTDFFSGDIDASPTVNVSTSTSGRSSRGGSVSRATLAGHYAGGIFNREHIARFAEGNKAEMVVPLENASAMQPFVDAVSSGIVGSLAPVVAMAGGGRGNNLQPLYVGTLVADERGLRELYKRFEVIQVQENARRGTLEEVF